MKGTTFHGLPRAAYPALATTRATGMALLDAVDELTIALYPPDAEHLARLLSAEDLDLQILAGAHRTPHGPLIDLVWIAAAGDDRRAHVGATLVDPHDDDALASFSRLAAQASWSVCVIAPERGVARRFVFDNRFDLQPQLDALRDCGRSVPPADFERACHELDALAPLEVRAALYADA